MKLSPSSKTLAAGSIFAFVALFLVHICSGAQHPDLSVHPDDLNVFPLELVSNEENDSREDDIILMGDVEHADAADGRLNHESRGPVALAESVDDKAAQILAETAAADSLGAAKAADGAAKTDDGGMSTSAIVGIAVGCAVGVLLISLIVVVIVRRDSKADKYRKMAAYEPATVQSS
jgi:hypothetical protein